MGVGLQPLEFTDCVTDSPYFRKNLQEHEKVLERTSQQMKHLIKELKDLLAATRNLSRAQRALSSSLQNFTFECIGSSQTDDEVVISKALGEFGRLIATIEDERDRMLERANEQIIAPLENFRKEHIGGVKEGKKKFEKQTAKFCQMQERYLNLSTKKQDAYLQEADATLEMERRYFIHASLEYVFLLQEVQERKKFEFVETLLSFIYGWLTFYHQGHEIDQDFKPYMNELQLRIQKTRENFINTRDKTEQLMKKTLEIRQTKPLDAGSQNKASCREGYLFLMEKKAFGTTWTKQYCSYQKDTKEFTMIPYNQMIGKFNASEKMTLASCVRRMSDSIEKRFCFDLTSHDKPGIVYTLQALSEDDRKEWMDIMDGKEPTYVTPGQRPKTEERQLDEAGSYFVRKCIDILESRGLEEQGLYRVVGVNSKVTKLLAVGLDRKKLEKLNLEDPCEWESKTLTSALKNYLRSLSEPIMTHALHGKFINAAKKDNQSERVSEIHALVHSLPPPNFALLEALIRHLSNVAKLNAKNLMTVSNLGVCFGPTLLRPEEETVAAIMDIKFCNVVVELLIQNYEKIFSNEPGSFTVENDTSNIPQPTPRQKDYQSMVSPSTVSFIKTKLYESMSQVGPAYMHAFNQENKHGAGMNMGTTRTAVPVRVMQSNSALPTGRLNMANLAAYSDSHLYSGPLPSSHPPNGSPQHSAPHLIHRGAMSSDALNSTSSSNESESSASSRDLCTANAGFAPKKIQRKPNKLLPSRYPPPHCRQQETRKVRTLYACLGENDGELSFEPNQIITNVKMSLEPGWLEGTLNGKTGLIPENYVEPLP